jgi:hypothetical protein
LTPPEARNWLNLPLNTWKEKPHSDQNKASPIFAMLKLGAAFIMAGKTDLIIAYDE